MPARSFIQRVLASALRIVVGVVGGVTLLVLAFAWTIRQPSVGSVRFPEGPHAGAAALRRHVQFLATTEFPRNPRNPTALARAAGYITDAFSHTHARVSEQPYQALRAMNKNLIARFGPVDGPVVIVGAHYDVFGNLPGADDNASGIAGLLELARLLDTRRLKTPVELVAFSTEEPPYFGGPEMGSAIHARSLKDAGVEVRAMICLEMIGYFSPEQPDRALLLHVVYPRTGDFISVVGRWSERGLVRDIKRCFGGASTVPAVSFSGPVIIGTDLSDHRNYWAAGFPSVMVTDTAYLRNPNYHSAGDVANSLDYVRMAGVVDGLLSSVVYLANRR